MIQRLIGIRTARLMDLKDQGHKIIDALVLSGMSRDVVYKKLKKKLKSQQSEHFSRMTTVEECERAVKILEKIRAVRISQMMAGEMKLHEEDRHARAQARVDMGLATKKETKYGIGVPVRNHPKSLVLPLDEQRKAYALLAKKRAERAAEMSTWGRCKQWVRTLYLSVRRYANVSQTKGATRSQDPHPGGGNGGGGTISIGVVVAPLGRHSAEGAPCATKYLDLSNSPDSQEGAQVIRGARL